MCMICESSKKAGFFSLKRNSTFAGKRINFRRAEITFVLNSSMSVPSELLS